MTTQPKRFNRRMLLRGAAATLVLVASGGVYRAVDQGVFSVGQGPAYEPWTTWRSDAQPGPLNLVRAAILAANPHNSQPWLFRVSDGQIDLYTDTTRNIGAVDPFLREMYIGVGCALENLALAAAPNGYRAEVALMPDTNDPTHAARIMLTQVSSAVSPLYDAIPHRHTNRGPYDTARPVSQETLDALRQLNDNDQVSIFWYAAPEQRQRVGDLIVEATDVFIADADQSRDSHRWFRHSWSAIHQFRDGLTLDAQSSAPLVTAAVKMLPDGSEEMANNFWRGVNRDMHVRTAAAFGLLAVRDHRDNQQRLSGGRLWQRMHLWATTQGLAMQPLNQLCERADREEQLGIEPRFGNALRELIGDPAWQALMPFRIGYPTVAGLPSPRRAVEDVVA